MATHHHHIELDTLIRRLHQAHPDLTIVGQPALPLEENPGPTSGQITITGPTSRRGYVLELRADSITLTVTHSVP